MYKLVIKDDESNKTVIAFYRQEITIGREEGNTIRLTEQNVSRTHAKLTKSNNLIFLEDTKSYVGTFLNEEKIEEQVQLNNGDEIKIGDYLITIINENEDNDETVLIKDDNSDKSKNDKKIKPVPVSEITGNKTEGGDSIEKGLDVSYPLKPPYNKIVFLDSNLAGTTFDILKSVMTIGKSPEADIVVTNKSLADIEAKIICNENSVKIKDISNKNRLKINGDPYTILELRESDIISMSSISFRYCDKNSKYVYKSKSGAKNNNKLFAIIAGVLLLAIILFFVFNPFDKTSKNNSSNKEKITTDNSNKKLKNDTIENKKLPKNKKIEKNTNDDNNDISPELMGLLSNGKELIKDKNWEKANEIYKQILKKSPNNKSAKSDMKLIQKELKNKKLYIDATKLFNNKKYIKSIEKFKTIPQNTTYRKKYEKKKTNYFEKIIKLTDKKIAEKNYVLARKYLTAANEINENSYIVIKRLNFIDKNTKNKKRVVKKKKTISKRNTGLAKALFSEGRNLGMTKPSAALKKLKAAMKADPLYAPPYLTTGMIYKNQLGRPKSAVRYFKKFLRLNPKYKRAATVRKWIDDAK